MKIIKIKVMLVYIIFLILINHIDVYASNYADEWLAKKQQQQEEYIKELEKDGWTKICAYVMTELVGEL